MPAPSPRRPGGYPSSPPARGFTLLELLVAMVIVGIIASFAVLSVGDGGRDATQRREAERLAALLSLAADEAVLRGRELGLALDPDGYAFLTLEGERWRPAAGDGPLGDRRLPAPFRLAAEVEGRYLPLAKRRKGTAPAPAVLLYSSGEQTPSRLSVEDPELRLAYVVTLPLVGAPRVDGPLEVR